MADVNIFGKKVPAWGVGLVAAGGVAALYFVYKQKQNAAAAAATTSTIDPLTGLPTSQDNVVDPLTGSTYLAEAQEYGSVSAAESALSGGSSVAANEADLLSNGGSGGGGFVGSDVGGAPPNSNVVAGTTYGSNSAWSQAVEAGLTDVGYVPTDVSAALGRYLSNLSETPAQASIVQAAIAEYGPPPVGSFQIISAPPTTATGTTTEVTIPNVVGVDVSQASSILTASGLKPSGPAGTAGVTHVVTSTTPAVGTQVASGSSVTLNYKSSPTVPNVVGEAQEAAFARLSAAGLKAKGTPVVKGKTLIVQSQSVKAGTSVPAGTTVTLVSKV